jgi:hypothetical protein
VSFSNSKGASFDSLEELMDDYRRNRPWHQKITDSVRLPFLWYVRNPIRDAKLAVRFAWQRVFRGWDDRSVWCLHAHLAKTLGGQLVYMSETSISYPGTEEYPTFELWASDLRRHGEALLALHRGSFDCETTDEEAALWRPAHEAMIWVANHLVELWD